MSANVWISEVDTALKQEILNSVKYRNRSGILVPIEKEAVTIRKPEDDFKIEMFPSVSIYNTRYKHDPSRYNPNPVVIGINEADKIALLEESAVPMNLSYQIDFWAKYQPDMTDMTKTWIAGHFRNFNLSVKDDGGNVRSCMCLQEQEAKKLDSLKESSRLFRTVFSYTIWVELDGEKQYNVSMVITRNLEAQENTE